MPRVVSREEIVRILPKGLMTIPVDLRRRLGFSENSLARVRAEEGKLVIEPVFTLPYKVRTYTDKEVKEFLNLDKKESKVLKRKGLL